MMEVNGSGRSIYFKIEGEQIAVRGDMLNLGNLEMQIIIGTAWQRVGSVFTLPQTRKTLSIIIIII
ncbi:MAG: hypothetical protein ACRCYY_15345 [Trueperaceae bacterium]